MQAQQQGERQTELHWVTVAWDICKTKPSAVIWSFLDLAQPLVMYWSRSSGPWAASCSDPLYTPLHNGLPSSPMGSCTKKGLQCSPKCPILPLYQRCNAFIRFPVGPSGYSWDIVKPRNLLWYNFVSNKMYNRLLKLLFTVMWQKEGLSYDVEYAGLKLHTSAKLLCNNGQRI